jgi:hypothetical protein
MSKKLLIGLVPLLAIAAFAEMPAVAQAACTPPACPHVYKNGVISPEGRKLRLIGWGTLKLTNSTLGEVECHDMGAGYAENPTGGGTAVGKLQAEVYYECVAEQCKALGGTEIEITGEKLPWIEELIEPEAGLFRIKIGKKGNTAEAIHLTVNCKGETKDVVKVEFYGEVAPKVLNNGLSIGAAPDEGEFDAGAGELESELLGGGKTTGKLKVEGYSAEELLEVRNP